MPIRTQADGLNEQYSREVAIDCSVQPDKARQEFKDETDVNKLLARYGVESLMRGEPQYQEIDYDMDLQSALESIKEAQRAIQKLPEPLQAKYGTWQQLMEGVYTGQVKDDLSTYYEDQKAEQEAAKAAIDKGIPPA